MSREEKPFDVIAIPEKEFKDLIKNCFDENGQVSDNAEKLITNKINDEIIKAIRNVEKGDKND